MYDDNYIDGDIQVDQIKQIIDEVKSESEIKEIDSDKETEIPDKTFNADITLCI